MSLREQQRANEKRLSRGTVLHTSMVLVPDPSRTKQWLKKVISGQYKCNGHLKLSKLEKKALKKATKKAWFEEQCKAFHDSLTREYEQDAFNAIMDTERKKLLWTKSEEYLRERVARLAWLFKCFMPKEEPTTCA